MFFKIQGLFKVDESNAMYKFMSSTQCICRNPSLGLATKAKAYKGAKNEAQESHFMLLGG